MGLDVKIIIAISVGGVFLLVFLIFVIMFFVSRNKQQKLQHSIEDMYADKNLAKMEYDFAAYDEETARIMFGTDQDDSQITIDDVLTEAQTAGDEGMEEITGNYKPE